MSRSVQERIEASAAGRSMISGLVVLLLLAIVVANLPPSHIRREELDLVRPYLEATGLRQGWGVFAPDPTKRSLEVFARIRFTDGSEAVWHPPEGDKAIGPYRFYRWRKLLNSAQDPDNDELARTLAHWVATDQVDGAPVQQVTLVRRTARTPEPGSDDPVVWEEEDFFTLHLPEVSQDGVP